MMRLTCMRYLSLVVIASLLSSVACGGAPARRAPHPSALPAASAEDVALARAGNQLGLELFARLGEGNLAISPASIVTALAMTYGGARGASATEMASTMHVTTSPDETMRIAGDLVRGWNDPARSAYDLSVANRLFGETTYPFAPAFLAATRDELGAELERLDFAGDSEAARGTINGWVSDRTHARIPEILPSGSVDGDIQLVLVNAVYFHGAWQERFDPAETVDSAFHTAAGADVLVPTMLGTRTGYGDDEGVQLLELPYAGGDVAMLFVLPRDRDGLAAIEARLSADRVQAWHERIGTSEPVLVQLPRFRIETGPLSLRAALVALGMPSLFSPEADLSGMSAADGARLSLRDVFHRVFVELNEEGTEAAAATAVLVQEESVQSSEPPAFVADHPFLFFLRDTRTGAILFSGRVVAP